MIPPRAEIEHLYDKAELDKLDIARKVNAIDDERERTKEGRRALRAIWRDEAEFIQKTHWIQTKNVGEIVLFKWNYAQKKLYEIVQAMRAELHPVRIVCLKARQLGCSTWMQSWQWEQCDREPHRNSMTVSFDEKSTTEMFLKVLVIRRNLWFPPLMQRDSAELLELKSGSAFHLRTAGAKHAGRSQTIHSMHLSECAMWDNADEVMVGLKQSVPTKPGTSIVLESTAQGAVGSFYEHWRAAERGESDYAAFFAPWYWDPEYAFPFPSRDHENAFGRSLEIEERKLAERHSLTLEQLHWRRWKIRNDCEGSVNKFRQEFPSTPAEAFLSTGAAVFDPEAVATLEQNAAQPFWVGEIGLER